MYRKGQEIEDPTLRLPRILCLHGGGTNARIFRAQCRGLIAQLKTEFRFVFAEGPFISEAGPDVTAVYGEWGPFKRWFRWLPEHPEITPEDAVKAIDQSLEDAIRQDTQRGATGRLVAILGFSQGAKLCASLLYRQQVRKEILGKGYAGSDYRFGVLLAGRAPLISLDPEADKHLTPGLPDASQITDVNRHNWSAPPICTGRGGLGDVLRIPTLHVHGMRDPGLIRHCQLFDEFCEPGSRRLVQWDGDHRVPLKANDVSSVVRQIRQLARDSE